MTAARYAVIRTAMKNQLPRTVSPRQAMLPARQTERAIHSRPIAAVPFAMRYDSG